MLIGLADDMVWTFDVTDAWNPSMLYGRGMDPGSARSPPYTLAIHQAAPGSLHNVSRAVVIELTVSWSSGDGNQLTHRAQSLTEQDRSRNCLGSEALVPHRASVSVRTEKTDVGQDNCCCAGLDVPPSTTNLLPESMPYGICWLVVVFP